MISSDDITLIAVSPAQDLAAGVRLPAIIEAACARAKEKFLEFFTAYIRNPNIRRAKVAGFEPSSVCCHTFRATGITTYLLNDGILETAQAIARHEPARATGLYDRREDEVTLTEIERIRI